MLRDMAERWGWALLLGCIVALSLAGCAVQPSPQDYAEAQAIEQRTADEAAQAALERAQAQVELHAAEDARAARTARYVLVDLGLGLGALVLLVGGALAAATWLHKQASTVYPNAAGQFPLIVQRDGLTGETIVHDPSRMLGPAAIYSSQDRVRRWVRAEPAALNAPVATDHLTQARITSQAQAAGLLVAATRGSAAPQARPMVEAVARQAFGDQALPRMPVVEVIEGSTDPRSHVDVKQIERAFANSHQAWTAGSAATDADDE